MVAHLYIVIEVVHAKITYIYTARRQTGMFSELYCIAVWKMNHDPSTQFHFSLPFLRRLTILALNLKMNHDPSTQLHFSLPFLRRLTILALNLKMNHDPST